MRRRAGTIPFLHNHRDVAHPEALGVEPSDTPCS